MWPVNAPAPVLDINVRVEQGAPPGASAPFVPPA